MVRRETLYIVAALIWGIPGVAITIKGVTAYAQMDPIGWWLLAITLGVLAMFFAIFRRVTTRYVAHIATQEEYTHLWRTFTPRGWCLILFMMCLGMTIRHIPQIPQEFIASFYSGLGPMLLLAALRFLHQLK